MSSASASNLTQFIFKREKKKGEKKKRESFFQGCYAGLSRFLRKILPVGWRFLLKPEGLDLDKPTARWH
jgi:hypothetical protein